MDRKSLVASLDVLSKNFVNPEDPFAVDLRTMAMALAKMDDSSIQSRLASDAPELEETLVQAAKTFKCPDCGTKVLEQTGYCVKCKKKVKQAGEEEVEEKAKDEKAPEACGDKEAFLVPPPRAIGERFKTLEMELGRVPGGIKSVYPEFKRNPKLKMLVETQPSAKDLIEKVKTLDKSQQEKALDLMESVVKNASCDFWTKEASNLVAKTLVADIIGVKAEAKEEEPAKEVPVPVVDEKAKEKEAAKEEAPAKEEVVAPVVPEAKKKEAPVEVEEPKDEVEASVVDTDILASYNFAGIEIPVNSMDEIGELSREEKANLAKLF